MKKIKNFFIIFIVSFILIAPHISEASDEKIYLIDIIVNLEDDGTARITQIWDVETHSGTEFYIPMTKLNKMKLENFSVKDEDDVEFDFIADWDIDASFEEKIHKCGINRIDGGFELCWGKGSYGRHRYTLNWDYKNAVQAYTDLDGFNIRFVNDKMNPSPQDINIIIKKNGVNLNSENTRIWGFGYEGSINFTDDGMIEAYSEKELTKDNYVNIMVNFDKGIFEPKIENNYSFSKLEEKAKEGSDYEKVESSKSASKGKLFVENLIKYSPILIIILLIIYFSKFLDDIIYYKDGKKINLKPRKFKKVKYKSEEYNREPLFKDRIDILHYIVKINDGSKHISRNIVSGYLLSWIKNGNIKIVEMVNEKGLIFKRKKSEVKLKIDSDPDFSTKSEKDLWDMILNAMGEDWTLDDNEFKKYVKRNINKYKNWIKNSEKTGGAAFLDMNGLEISENSILTPSVIVTDKGYSLIKKVYGLKKYLKDFTIINERGAKEVELWDDYLIAASVFGIGEQVARDMAKLVPDYSFGSGENSEDIVVNSYILASVFNIVNDFAEKGDKAYTASQGGGGDSSSGGGGGFSGGGSGGGSR